jgi:membrane-associated protein
VEVLRDALDLLYGVLTGKVSLDALVRWGGYVVLTAIVFTETGLLIGFFLPGDSLLITAGLFAARGDLDIVSMNVSLCLAAIAGDATGYWIGKRAGQALYNRPKSLLFRREHLIKTHEFYERHGGKTIVIARFMPILRTFAPVVAGAALMTYRNFAVYNVIGGIGWVTSMTLGGFFLGRAVPDLDQHIHLVVAVVIFLSLLPAVIAWLRERIRARAAGSQGASL